MLLYAVTDRAWVGRQSLLQQVESALKGGITCLQLREKGLDRAAFLAEALEIKALAKAYRVPFIVNDDVEVALACGADGVHVGQSDMDVQTVRKCVGPQMIVGVSVQTAAQAALAEQLGADYLGVGAVFPTETKPDAAAVSPEALGAICRAASIPVVAIGGINRSNLPALSGSGVDGVALVSAIFSAPDIQNECRVLRSLAKEMVGR